MPRPARVSPDRILAAAAREFAQRGYAGARVDRIARLARVNKAMLYYHFGSKQALYRTLLRDVFGSLAAEFDRIAAAPGGPQAHLDLAVDAMAALVGRHEHVPAIMMREVAEGGTHLDAESLKALAAVPAAFGRLLAPGIDAGVFRRLHPFAAYLQTVAPILMFLASAPVRRQMHTRRLLPGGMAALEVTTFIAEMKHSIQRALAGPLTN